MCEVFPFPFRAKAHILTTVAGLEKIVAGLPSEVAFRPVFRAVRDGAVTGIDPGKVYCYVYGAVHALRIGEETWELIDAELDRLVIAGRQGAR